MAAPSVGRRSCAGQKREAAALITQSRRWSYGRVKELLYDGFFSFCRRPADKLSIGDNQLTIRPSSIRIVWSVICAISGLWVIIMIV